MPTASKSGNRNPSRRNWRDCDRPRSRPGPRAHRRLNPFTELASALGVLIRLHEAHPEWAPTVVRPVPLNPEWEAAIHNAYHPDPSIAGIPRVASGDPSAVGQTFQPAGSATFQSPQSVQDSQPATRVQT
jgi:hypothetical protein